MTRSPFSLVAVSVLLLLGMPVGCSSNSPTATLLFDGNGWRDRAIAIRQVNTEVELGKVVVVQGKTIRRVPFLEGGAYLLQGKTGKIWVSTSSASLPLEGTQVVVQGKLDYRQITIEGREMGQRYLREEKREETKQQTHEARSTSSRDRNFATGRPIFAATAR
ncbi:hypothetical protein [Geitlerinema sp. PCC 9228]|jgi:hypothetical protein|uniref:hypothetical protein n=1 Tax=Geitlerinema sp. PCC 9228 TaxID=111611 RepID=UPI00111487EE|nr:hypothetical protein [Geitlerinema sp. PCC 9228]